MVSVWATLACSSHWLLGDGAAGKVEGNEVPQVLHALGDDLLVGFVGRWIYRVKLSQQLYDREGLEDAALHAVELLA
jgi:hypothetical protein